jgi:hypothetical protein
MLVIRCTQRAARRFKLRITDEPPSSTGVLGDWYANLLNVGTARWGLCQSERSLLPLILPARNECFPIQFGSVLGVIVRKLGVREDHIAQELSSANEIVFSRPRSRQVLGVMNDFAFNAAGYLDGRREDDTALVASLKLAEMPSSPIGYESPGRLTIALFENSKHV